MAAVPPQYAPSDLQKWAKQIMTVVRRQGKPPSGRRAGRRSDESVPRVDGLPVGDPMSKDTLKAHLHRHIPPQAYNEIVAGCDRLYWVPVTINDWTEWRVGAVASGSLH